MLDEHGRQTCEIGGSGTPAGKLASPSGVVCCGELIYVAERWAHRVRCLRLAEERMNLGGVAAVCELVACIGGREGAGAGRLSHPMGLTLSGNGKHLFVADSYNHRVCRLDAASLAFLDAFGANGERYGSIMQQATGEPGALRYPVGLTTHIGELFVADSENHRIAVYAESDGAFARSIGGAAGKGPSRMPGAFNEPEGVAVARGWLIVSEAAGCRLQVLTLCGIPLQILSSFSGRLAGVCVTEDRSRIVVEDFYLDELISLDLVRPAIAQFHRCDEVAVLDGPVAPIALM